MNLHNSPEFRYSSLKLPVHETAVGEHTPRTGDFTVRNAGFLFKSSYPEELSLLGFKEKKAYDLRWGMKGHPKLFQMIGQLLDCSENEAHRKMQEISLKVRYYTRLCPN